MRGTADLIDQLREEAAKVGCDAIVLTGTRNQVVGNGATETQPAHVGTNKGYAATCIVFHGDSPAPPPGPPPTRAGMRTRQPRPSPGA